MKDILTRTISGIIYVALFVIALLLGWPFFLGLTAIFAILGIIEFNRLTSPENSLVALFIDGLATIMIVLTPSIFTPHGLHWGAFFGFSVLGCFLLRLIITLFDYSPSAFSNLAHSVFGVIYVGLPLALLNATYMMLPECKWVVLCMLILIWLNDTGAFCFGSMLGKRKLCERLSPKKSWEGFWGGMGCCLAFSVAAFYIFRFFPLVSWLIFGALVCLFSTWGDLLESLIKRSMHAKDSGHLIPGHGGILDRIDSLLLVAPVTFIFTVVMVFWYGTLI